MAFSAFIGRSIQRTNGYFGGRACFATALIFDTETTSRVDRSKPVSHPVQPDLVQLGMILVDTDTWKTKSEMCVLVQLRENVSIEPGAQAVHNISAEECQDYGVDPSTAALLFSNLYHQADVLVAHNLDFDASVMETALYRSNNLDNNSVEEESRQLFYNDVDGRQCICTMKSSTNVLKLRGRKSYKWPKLEEAYEYVTGGEKLEGGHNALVDCSACLAVFQYLVKEGIVSLPSNEGTKEEKTMVEHVKEDDTKEEKKKKTKKISSSVSGLNISKKRNGGFAVSGPKTFMLKNQLRSHGGSWDWKNKAWVFEDQSILPIIEDLADSKKASNDQ